jgi:hypothetical protein
MASDFSNNCLYYNSLGLIEESASLLTSVFGFWVDALEVGSMFARLRSFYNLSSMSIILAIFHVMALER